ncbi:hypothetical protein [Mesorhizobium sp.]|uniref:hypothetical protein n=1 Tax=Mesorhizobium sp. TaxID=1871066 RepID=UPI000FEA2672|nr:hypothetical protein [Mesorhizobium sp.]RWE40347.1 MAG: hypothetical protein EOS80_30630 [Mesorhizobium sp.]TIV23215.1 MAG: hypothetical protein E5V99_25740 [Mesorhizobium sp.]TIV44867.1 MAG: hypothetical protein E5V96_13850 [Mesorhizobium sp.]
MPKPIAWSFNAGSSAASVGSTGTLDVEAVTGASIAVAKGAKVSLALQLEHIDKLKFVYIAADSYSGKIKIKAGAADEIGLEGPVILFGAAIGLLGPSFATLSVTNGGAEPANVEIMIGGQLS